MELNESYRYETRLEKEKTVLHCVFVSSFRGKQGKRYPNLLKDPHKVYFVESCLP